jgi:integrase
MLADNVVHLDPAPSVLAAMLQGWRRQQSARFLRVSTIGPRIQLVERLVRFSGLYPWQWTAEEGEAFIDDLRNKQRPIKVSTARCYEVEISLFIEFLRDPRYGWGRVCEDRFGEVPQPIFHEGNSILHKTDYEGDPRRRPLTYDELQAFFDAADARPGKIIARGAKGELSAARDAVVLKMIYAYGLRAHRNRATGSGGSAAQPEGPAVPRLRGGHGALRQGVERVRAEAAIGSAGSRNGLGHRCPR